MYSQQIECIKQKLIKSNCLLAKIRHFVPQKLLQQLYYAHIQPFINYGNLIWSVAAPTYLTELSKVVNKSVRIISFSGPKDSTALLYKSLKILSVEQTIKLAMGKLIWKLKNMFLPETTCEVFVSHRVSCNQRSENKYILPFRSSLIGKRFVTYDGLKIWNAIPEHISKCSFYNVFKKSFQSFLLLEQ